MHYANIDISNAILYDAKYTLTTRHAEERVSSRLSRFLGNNKIKSSRSNEINVYKYIDNLIICFA